LTMRILGFDDLKNQFFDTLLECGKTLSALDDSNPGDTRGWMEREVDREYAQVKVPMYADVLKPFSNDDFEREVENLRTFARQRRDFVTSEVAKARGQ
jgi:hypothetical protein